ncbi:MAG: hydrogenase maturation protease [Terriglobia bacterium]|jgi:hydrogenase maturation protease
MSAMTPEVRVLCLGNELLADDALGLVAAEELRRRFPHLDVVFTTDSGFHLLDYLSDCTLLVVVDSIQTGQVPGGTLLVFPNADIQSPSGPSPHYVGLFETLQLGRKLVLPVPEEVIILAVEAVDCLTLGGEMHPAVKSAVGLVAELVGEIVQCTKPTATGQAVALADCLQRAFATVSARYAPGRMVLA